MKTDQLKIRILDSICIVAFILILGYAGKADYNEQVLYGMPDSVYQSICAKLGPGCSDSEIVN